MYPPVTLAGRLFMKTRGRELLIGSCVAPAKYAPTISMSTRADRFDADHVDFVFRPSADVLLRPTERVWGYPDLCAHEIWGEEIVLKDVPVDRSAVESRTAR